MTKVATTQRALQEQLLGSVLQTQQATVDAVGAWGKAVDRTVPSMPAIHIPRPDVPGPGQVLDNAFTLAQNTIEFTQQILGAQRDFGRGLIRATRPVLRKAKPGSGGRTVVPGSLSLEALTVKDLDRLAEANAVENYPQDAPKARKVRVLEAAEVLPAA